NAWADGRGATLPDKTGRFSGQCPRTARNPALGGVLHPTGRAARDTPTRATTPEGARHGHGATARDRDDHPRNAGARRVGAGARQRGATPAPAGGGPDEPP